MLSLYHEDIYQCVIYNTSGLQTPMPPGLQGLQGLQGPQPHSPESHCPLSTLQKKWHTPHSQKTLLLINKYFIDSCKTGDRHTQANKRVMHRVFPELKTQL